MQDCPYCNKQFKSYKSWHRHKTLSHSNEIKPPNWKSQQYLADPHKCEHPECDNVLTFDQRHQKYCSSSCSAKITNTTKDQANKVNTWRSKLGTLKRDRPRPYRRGERKVTDYTITKMCPSCDRSFTSKSVHHTYCNPTCNPSKSAKVQYRNECKFKLNPKDHHDLYDFDLIESNGWYRPSNSKNGPFNPDGVTWDHLYRLEEGFKNHVDPTIMSHPANAEMLTWRDNQRRRTSQITLEELHQRIENWCWAPTTKWCPA